MKKIALLLLLAVCFSAFAGFTVSAEESADVYYNVPMNATVCVYFAVKATHNPQGQFYVQKGDGEFELVEASAKTTISDEEYIVFKFDNLGAHEMDVTLTAKVGESGSTVSCSVVQFLDEFADNDNYGDVAKAMKAYGEAAKIYAQQ